MQMNGKEEALSHSFDGMCIIAIDSKKVKSRADYKVKYAHELGHCITGAFYNESCPVVPRGRCERRATLWAIHNIIPRNDLLKAMKSGLTEIWELAEHFGVTEKFMIEALRIYGYYNG